MSRSRVVAIEDEGFVFDDGYRVFSSHDPDCCEHHYLSTSDLTLQDFDGMVFDLESDDFFRRVDGYGIELIPLEGWGVKVPGYGDNNGYYSSNLALEVTDPDGKTRSYDITECQDY